MCWHPLKKSHYPPKSTVLFRGVCGPRVAASVSTNARRPDAVDVLQLLGLLDCLVVQLDGQARAFDSQGGIQVLLCDDGFGLRNPSRLGRQLCQLLCQAAQVLWSRILADVDRVLADTHVVELVRL